MKTKERTGINKVAGYRIMLGLNQSEAAEMIGVSKQSYWNKENGRTAFSDKEKKIFKDKLLPYFPDLSIDDIFF